MKFPYQKIVTFEEETAELAHNFMQHVSPGDVVVLNGNLGTGKTFFIKRALEISGINTVSSPTFALVNEYNNSLKFYHFDFYRINKVQELLDIGFNDYMNDNEAVTFIEWGEMFEEILPHRRIEINIKMKADSSREFSFKEIRKE